MGIKPQVHRSRTAGAQVKPRVGGPKSRNIDGNPLGEMLGGDIQHPPIADASSMSRQSDVGKLRPRLSEREMDDVSNQGVPVDEADPHGIVGRWPKSEHVVKVTESVQHRRKGYLPAATRRYLELDRLGGNTASGQVEEFDVKPAAQQRSSVVHDMREQAVETFVAHEYSDRRK